MESPLKLESRVPDYDFSKTRSAIKLSGLALFSLTFQTLGIIYSDIGTSPLYTLNGIWSASGGAPSKDDIIGGVSAIIWALTLLPLIKYVFISLEFGTGEGEGGTFALYQGLFPPEHRDIDADRTLTGDSHITPSVAIQMRSGKISERLRWPLLVWALFGTSLTIADGIFTPAVSVTSAVSGIGVAKPSIINNIAPISIAILVVLFLGQRFGTARLACLFAPVSFLWFILLAVTGILNIARYPGIFTAFDPSRAVMLFVRTRDYDILAGVLLAVTGCEAVFANLGQFNALSIRLSFSIFVYPSLVLAYLGQGARLIIDGDNVINNVFYQTIPGQTDGPLFWFMFVVALLATIIASQAMITATFSLVQQLVNMKALPPLKMVYTSETIQGQIYVPAVDWLLLIATVAVVGAFKNLTALSNAYGFSVATVMFSTTILLSVHMKYVKHWPVAVGIVYLLAWGFFDGLFWGAALKKVPLGAWVPLMIGLIVLSVMLLWTWAKGLEDDFDRNNRRNLRSFIVPSLTEKSPCPVLAQDEAEIDGGVDNDDEELLTVALSYMSSDANGKAGIMKGLARIPTCAIFHKITQGKGVPHTFVGFIQQWPSIPRIVIFLSLCVVPTARIPVEDRYVVNKVRTIDGFYGVTYYVGFRDDFDVQIGQIIEKICNIEMQISSHESALLNARIAEIRNVGKSATHIAPHYHVMSRNMQAGRILTPGMNWLRAFLIEGLYRRLATMFPDTGNWITPADEIIHVGINAHI